MSEDSKSNPLFTIVPDDIIRSGKLTSTELHLYTVMLSYCTKKRSEAPKVCRMTKKMMAGILRVSDRRVYTLIRKLEEHKLLTITFREKNPNQPIYMVATSLLPASVQRDFKVGA